MTESTENIYWSLGLIPVQEWIAEARRSRDLRAGSAFLSWTVSKLLAHLIDILGASVELPHPPQTTSFKEIAEKDFSAVLDQVKYSLPNRASGSISGRTLRDVQSAFECLQHEIVDAAWRELRKDVTQHNPFPKKFGDGAWSLIRQWVHADECPIQLIWCAEALTRPTRSLEKIDQLYSSVKRTRPIPCYQGYPIGKCGQCGKREAIGQKTWTEWRRSHEELEAFREIQNGYRFDPGERLCGVCIIKRLAAYASSKDFPSTSKIAASDWLNKVSRYEDFQALLAALQASAKQVEGFEELEDIAPLYYPRTVDRMLAKLKPLSGKDSGSANRKASLETVQVKQKALLQKIEDRIKKEEISTRPGLAPLPHSQPSNYLAVLTFDGDAMGKTVQQHSKDVPRKISEFAAALNDPLRAHFGEAFYLGGDEGLVLCPIESVLDLANAIHNTWKDTISETTVSMGIAIFDRERPLGAAIAAARSALKSAKGMDEKSALAITVQTASGNEFTALDHWGESWERVRKSVGLILDGNLSASWPHDLESLLQTIPEQAWVTVETRNAIREEARRITRRRVSMPQKGAGHDETKSESRRAEAQRIWKEELKGEKWWQDKPETEALQNLPDLLHLTAFLVRESGLHPGRQDKEDARE